MAIRIPTSGHMDLENGQVIGETFEGTITISQGMATSVPIGSTWENVHLMNKSWEMSVSCNYNPADAGQAALRTGATSGDNLYTTIAFYEDACGVYSGSAILTSAVITKSVGSVDKLSVSFTGNGVVAYGARTSAY
jgi:hypothetical protein